MNTTKSKEPTMGIEIDLDKLEQLATDVQGWSNISAAWANTDDFEDEDPGVQQPTWIVGAIEDGTYYDVAVVDCEQYSTPGESEKLAKFYAASNPAVVLELVHRLRKAQVDLNELRNRPPASWRVKLPEWPDFGAWNDAGDEDEYAYWAAHEGAQFQYAIIATAEAPPTKPVRLTDAELWNLRNHVAVEMVTRDDTSEVICRKHGRAIETAVLRVNGLLPEKQQAKSGD